MTGVQTCALPISYSNKASRNRVLSSSPNLAIRPIASTKPQRLLLANPQSFPRSKTLYTLWISVSYVWVQISSQGMTVRLNLINHLVGFILCQFACNSTLRNPVFRWESCKGSVWESVKKCSRMCTKAGTCDWISQLARGLQVAKGCTRVKYAEELNSHSS